MIAFVKQPLLRFLPSGYRRHTTSALARDVPAWAAPSMPATRESRCVLQLNKVSRRFGTDPVVHALQNVDLQLNRGDWLSITGPSGAGKSTLLNIIGCLDTATSGTYCFDGINVSQLTDRQRAGLRSRRIGFVFQAFHLLPYRSVLENVMLAEVYRRQSHRGRKERALAAIERVGLSDKAHVLPSKLSGGQRQRVAIARALIGSPSLLLCDEPTGNLDSESTANILNLFETLNRQGLTLVVVTHEDEVAQSGGRRVEIVDGRLKELTSPRETDLTCGHEKERPAESQWIKLPDGHVTPASQYGEVTRSGITLRDLGDEAVAGIFARPGRMIMTVLGILIGLTALVATLGLSRTAGNQILTQFDELSATEIFITSKSGGTVDDIPWDAPARLQRLNGVVAAGLISEVEIGDTLVSSSPVRDPQSQTAFSLAVLAASPELFPAVRATLQTGRLLDAGHSRRADRVAVLGPAAAEKLGVRRLSQLPAIAVGDHLYVVIGILKDVARRPEMLGAVVIPEGTAARDFGLSGPHTVVIETRIGAASLIARQSPLALRPDNPAVLKVEYPPEPQKVRNAVQSDLNVMFLLLGGLTLIVGAIGIGNITLVSVIERTGEIGLRRAIGATQGHIAAQFLLESMSLGIVGGILGSFLGLLTVLVISAYQTWTPVLDPAAPFITPLVGGAIGLLAGTYPALRAARLEPVEAFRY